MSERVRSADSGLAQTRTFYLPQLDGLRFMAFLLVFIHHAPPIELLAPLKEWGWCGVDLFLVLSAFLITTLLLLEHGEFGRISLSAFYVRRILRIWPLYYLMACVGFFALPAVGVFAPQMGSRAYGRFVSDFAPGYFTLFGNYVVGRRGWPPVWTLAHLWTVTLEEQFYLVWPVLLVMMLRGRSRTLHWWVLGALLVGSIALRWHYFAITHHPFIWTNTLMKLDPLVTGAALAFYRHQVPPSQRPFWPALLEALVGAGLVALAALGSLVQSQSSSIVWQFTTLAFGFGLVLDSALTPGGPVAKLLARPALVWLGKVTYGLYIYHILALQLMREVVALLNRDQILTSPGVMFVVEYAGALLLTVLTAALSFRFFERPFLKLKAGHARVRSRPVDELASSDPASSLPMRA